MRPLVGVSSFLVRRQAAPLAGAALWATSTLPHIALAQPATSALNATRTDTNTLSLQWANSTALTNHPSLKAAHARWRAALARVPQARAWDDPRAGLDVERRGTTRFTATSDNEWTLAQTVPLSGKNTLRARAAEAEAAVAWAEWRRAELELRARVPAAYFLYAHAYLRLALNRTNELLLRQAVELTRTKFEAGTRPYADVLTAELDLTRLLEDRLDLELEILNQQTELNTLLARSPHDELPPPTPLSFKPLVLPPPRAPSTGHGEPTDVLLFDWPVFHHRMLTRALEHRPELYAAERRVASARARVELARRAWLPDPELRLEARQLNGFARGIDEYDTGIFLRLPWLNRRKYQAAIEEAKLNLAAAEQELAALRLETQGRVRTQSRKVQTLQDHFQFLRDNVVPKARQVVEAALIAYREERSGLLELLSAQRVALHAEQTLQQHLVDYLIAVAELDALIGDDAGLLPRVCSAP
jgi:outer membrane protein TolC